MNLASILKSEISRVSRKEVRTELQGLKKTITRFRSDNVDLKRRLVELEKLVKQFSKGGAKKTTAAAPSEPAGTVARFSGKGLAAQRKRLGLSAAEMGVLLVCSGQSVYKWGAGHDRSESQSAASHRCAQEYGQERSGCKVGPARQVIWVWPGFWPNSI